MILHIPHASRELGNYVRFTNEQENLDSLTDTYVREIFSYYGCDIIEFPLSRFVCDVERFVTDEPMESKGQGIIYRKDVFGNDVERLVSDDEIYKLYKEHHRQLNVITNKQLTYYENVVIVDCHTFTPTNVRDPDVCIGTDFQHTPLNLISIVRKYFENRDFKVDIDNPYEGTIIPSIHSLNENVKSIMIEINKDVYVKGFNINALLEEINDYEWNIA